MSSAAQTDRSGNRPGEPGAEEVEDHDLVIVGSGSGNAIPAELDDWRVALVERDVFGGTCLNRGCIPSKMYVVAADAAERTRHAHRLGVHATVDRIDWPAIRDRIFGRIDPISAGGEAYRDEGCDNVTLVRGTARFVRPDVLAVGDRLLRAPKILLAAGTRPVAPEIPGLAEAGFHTSDDIMRLEQLPRRLGILGGGFIAAEMGHVFSAFGTEVTVMARSHTMLRPEDHDIRHRFTEAFRHRVDLRLGAVPDRIWRHGDAIEIHLGEEVVEVDELLVATGRVPNSDLLEVWRAGLEVHPDGRVVTDETMATSVPGIWAVGDLTNEHQLKHVANAEAKVAFWNLTHPDQPRRMDYSAVPYAIFSDPQVARVGLTEDQARDRGLPFVIGCREYGGTAYGWALEDQHSMAKVVVHAETGQILGAHVVGEQAANLIQPLIQAMRFGQTADQVATDVLYTHPALVEVIENALLEAVSKLT
jgi:mycothione reductase